MLLSYVFSFRNEEGNINTLVKKIDEVTQTIYECDYEMIFVNDDSTDKSLNVLLTLQDKYPIKIINMSRNFGVTPCVIAGFTHAKGDAVIYMDADLQDPPEIVPELVKKYRDGCDVVHTTRIKRKGENKFKMFITNMAYNIINWISDINLPKNTGDFKLLSAKVVKDIINIKEYDPYMRGLSVWVGYKQEHVMYQREPRFKGSTKFPIFSKGPLTEFIRGITSFSAMPLYFSFLVGLFTCFMSVCLIIYALITKLFGISAPGASGLLIAVGFFNGIVLITNGLIGLYIARIYYEVKGRPRYIISSIIDQNKKNK